jgi:hypothetical protein
VVRIQTIKFGICHDFKFDQFLLDWYLSQASKLQYLSFLRFQFISHKSFSHISFFLLYWLHYLLKEFNCFLIRHTSELQRISLHCCKRARGLSLSKLIDPLAVASVATICCGYSTRGGLAVSFALSGLSVGLRLMLSSSAV